MKRFGFTLVAALCLSASMFAAGNQPTTEKTVKWNSSINVNKLSKFLNLENAQYDEVSNICQYFDEQMSRATGSKKDQDAKVRNAVYANLKLMKKVLNEKQYANYTKVLNMTLKNRGIEVK